MPCTVLKRFKGSNSNHPCQPPSRVKPERRDNSMKGKCRTTIRPTWRTREMAVTELLRHVTVVSDPVRLAYLKAEAAKNKGKNEGSPARVRRRPGPSTLLC